MSPPIEISVWSPEFLADPFPIYRRLRAEDPVHWSSEMYAWLISRYADVKQLLHDDRVTPDQKEWPGYRLLCDRPDAANVRWALDETLLLCDGNRHARRRRFANQPFQAAGCERIARVTEHTVREVLDGLSGRREVELFGEFCAPVRIRVMSRLLGPTFTPQEEQFLLEGTNRALGFLEPSVDPEVIARNDRALAEFRAFVEAIVDRGLGGRGEASSSILGDLSAESRTGDRLSRDEIVSLVFSFLLAGTEANGSLITIGVMLLLEHREELELLLAEPHRFPQAVREILRFRSFTKFLPRYVRSDFELRGKTLRRGDIALLMFQCAFRDEAAFVDPDRFDVRREHTNELAFGFGPHRCVGERMAEIEGSIALREFFTRYPRARLRDAQGDWHRHHMMVAVPGSLPVIPIALS